MISSYKTNIIPRHIIIAIIALFFVALTSCASQRYGYKPVKKKKKDCDCSKWSYNDSKTFQLKKGFLKVA